MSADPSALAASSLGVIVPLATVAVAYKIVDNTMRGSYDRPMKSGRSRKQRPNNMSIWKMY